MLMTRVLRDGDALVSRFGGVTSLGCGAGPWRIEAAPATISLLLAVRAQGAQEGTARRTPALILLHLWCLR